MDCSPDDRPRAAPHDRGVIRARAAHWRPKQETGRMGLRRRIRSVAQRTFAVGAVAVTLVTALPRDEAAAVEVLTYHNDNAAYGPEPGGDDAHAGERQPGPVRQALSPVGRRLRVRAAALRRERDDRRAGAQRRHRRDRERHALRIRRRLAVGHQPKAPLEAQPATARRDRGALGGDAMPRSDPQGRRDQHAGDRPRDLDDLRGRQDQGATGSTSTACTRSTSRRAPRSSAARS